MNGTIIVRVRQMLNDLSPFYDPNNICYENVYVSVCKALNRNYKNIYTYSWNFGYMPFSNLKGMELFTKRIQPSRDLQVITTEQINAIERYCGVYPILHVNCRYDEFIDVVKMELENNRPVAIGTDIFYCNWHKVSNKYHSMHYCLIIGINKDGFICIDDTIASTDGNLILQERPKSVMLGFDTLKRFNYGFITFKIGPSQIQYSSDEMIYISALKTLTGFNKKSDFDNMRNLVSDIYKYLDIDKEIEGYEDPWAIGLVRSFNYIAWSRSNYCMFLNDKQTYKGADIHPISNRLINSMNLWNGIKNYIMKYASEPGKSFDKNLICDTLNEIITIEEKLAKEIVND